MQQASTYVEVLAQLAHEDIVCRWLRHEGLHLEDQPNQEQRQEQQQHSAANASSGKAWALRVAGAIERLKPAARDRLIAALHGAAQLGDVLGRQAMFQAAAMHPEVMAGLARCTSDLQRSFWLYTAHRDIFELACASEYLDAHDHRTQQFDLGVHIVPSREPAARQALRDAISDHCQRKYGCGDTCVVQLFERSPGVYMLRVYIRDLPTLQLEFDGQDVRQRLGHPSIHMVLEYAPATGIARTTLHSSAECHRLFVGGFARFLLGIEQPTIRLVTLDLSPLRQGAEVHRPSHGFVRLWIESLTAMNPSGSRTSSGLAVSHGAGEDIVEQLRKEQPGREILDPRWTITAAVLVLSRVTEPGAGAPRDVTVKLTHRGQLNLQKFDAPLQAQIEGYLVNIGVLQPDQTLHAELDPDLA